MAELTSPQPRNFLEYKLTSFLGSGSFGFVWEMDGGENEKASALKVILVHEEKQRRELGISTRLSHSNLVKVFKIERKEVTKEELDALVPKGDNKCHAMIAQLGRNENFEVFCITLELCGETLRNWLKEEHDIESTETKVTQLGIVKGIVEGLKYLHEKKIIHRELKPENIMFSKKGYVLPVKIGDYGTRRILKDPQTSILSSCVETELYKAPETLSNDYGLYSDVFSLGLIIWEVLQLLPFLTLKDHFDRLVNDEEKELVNLNPCFQGFTDLIVKMVQRNGRTRHKNLDEINPIFCNLGTGKEFVAANSEELKVILEVCGDGANIQLLEGVFEGEFVVAKKGVTLKGQSKEKTILSSSNLINIVLTVLGEEFSAENFKIDGRGGNGVGGIEAEAANCSLENIAVCNIPNYFGVIVWKRGLNTNITNMRFEDVEYPLSVYGDNCSLSNITINNCKFGISVGNVEGLLLQSVSITNPTKCGITLEGCCKPKIMDVKIKKPLTAIWVRNCPQGVVELRNVRCSGFDGEKEKNCGIFIDENSVSVDIQIADCKLGKVIKEGE